MPLSAADKTAIKQKYAEERDKRLRPDGNAQYQRLETTACDEFAADPHTPFQERGSLQDHVTFAFIGAGFAGLVVGARLREAGLKDVRLIEKGGDVGGTWYWNRYPGAQCDTASMVYLPLLEETGHMPTEKYVHGKEIRQHCVRIAEQYDLYRDALFHTVVTGLEWQEGEKCWRVETNRGDAFTAKYIGMGTGPLHVAKLPGIEGIERFQGASFHTSRWDYAYTGGDADGTPLEKLRDKRVAVIGTGATAVQCVPRVAETAGHLYVFQRTPSSVDVRGNGPIETDWFASVAEPGWQQRWLDNFLENMSPAVPEEDLVMDGWTEISRRIREAVLSLPPSELNLENLLAASEGADMEKMEQIRARVDAVVEDTQTAAKLKAWYAQLCKRPCFHDHYLQAFNSPNTTLVDTDGKGVERITETGVVADGQLYEVDCIIFASGFEVGTGFTDRAGFDLKGRDGQSLSQQWADGMRTLHGIHMHGFPNAFLVQMSQAGNFLPNVPHNIVDHANTIAAVVAHAEAEGAADVEPEEAAVSGWVELILSGGQRSVIGSPDCTPGYYNNEGQGWSKQFLHAQGHPGGARAYFEHIEKWRKSGDFEGLRFTK